MSEESFSANQWVANKFDMTTNNGNDNNDNNRKKDSTKITALEAQKRVTELEGLLKKAREDLEKLQQSTAIEVHDTVQIEPLMMENPNRYVLFPIQYDIIWQKYKQQIALFWTPEEIDFEKDLVDWHKLNESEQHFIKNVLAFFAGSDGIVLENLASRFMNEIDIPEVKCFYGFQIMMENIHSETYSLMIDTYVKDSVEKNRLLNAIDTIPSVQRKAKWAIRWINDRESSFATRLIAFAIVEGIFFSGSFCAIFWLKKRGLMPGLSFSNELISRDEGLHTDFAVLLYGMMNNKLSESVIYEMVKEAVSIEKEFILDSIPCHLIGMNSQLMSQYIEFVADRLVTQLGYAKIWNTPNPFDFMEMISMTGKTNFFEKRNGEYRRAGVGLDQSQMRFDLESEF